MSTAELNVRVVRKTREAEGIFSFRLSAVGTKPLPGFEPGAHIDVHVPGGPIRQYSLCSLSPDCDRYEIAVLREPASRGGSVTMHDVVDVGHILPISSPRNHFSLRQTGGRPLLLAGGIGITPILCMAEKLSVAGSDFEMHYWSRTASRTAFLERIRQSAFAPKVAFHLDDGRAEQRLSFDDEALFDSSTDRHVYLCGPTGFIAAAQHAAHRRGWASDRIHFEHFAPVAQSNPDGEAFEVQLATTGAIYEVPPGKTVSEVLAEHSVNVPMSCEQGICGTCLTRVISGIPEHRDLVLTPAERARNDQFTPCCSRSISRRLVIDL